MNHPGLTIKAERERKGLRQQDLHKKTGISITTISNLENQFIDGKQTTVRTLLDALSEFPEPHLTPVAASDSIPGSRVVSGTGLVPRTETAEGTIRLPLLEAAPTVEEISQLWSLAVETIAIAESRDILNAESCFAYRVTDNEMADCIRAGDVVVIDTALRDAVENGDVVMIRYRGNTCMRVMRIYNSSESKLIPNNSRYDSFKFPNESIEIIGVVVVIQQGRPKLADL